jgi:23S rRNA (guanosine2251-2'-O)-methyltransferase
MTEIAYGIHAVQALLKLHPQSVQRIAVQKPVTDRLKLLLSQARQQGVAVQLVDKQALLKLVPSQSHHQGVVASYSAWDVPGEAELLNQFTQFEAQSLLLILDGLTDPHNFGACLRTAAAVGVAAVIFPKDKSARLTPTVHHVAAGAGFSLPLYQVTNLARVMRALQACGVWIYGTDSTAPSTLYETHFTGPSALVVGSEGDGMRRLTQQHCDHLIQIPMTESVESLNVSVATGVCLYEMQRQTRPKPGKI